MNTDVEGATLELRRWRGVLLVFAVIMFFATAACGWAYLAGSAPAVQYRADLAGLPAPARTHNIQWIWGAVVCCAGAITAAVVAASIRFALAVFAPAVSDAPDYVSVR